jgi:hypothetical protein
VWPCHFPSNKTIVLKYDNWHIHLLTRWGCARRPGKKQIQLVSVYGKYGKVTFVELVNVKIYYQKFQSFVAVPSITPHPIENNHFSCNFYRIFFYVRYRKLSCMYMLQKMQLFHRNWMRMWYPNLPGSSWECFYCSSPNIMHVMNHTITRTYQWMVSFDMVVQPPVKNYTSTNWKHRVTEILNEFLQCS